MILFPNCKINIGLNILRRRSDNFHDLETVFYPLKLSDALEINISESFNFSISGIVLSDSSENIAVKAYKLLISISDYLLLIFIA
jgi:4-diphosphocytidyl-2-C-methyl-D-erythritol kinase